MGAVRSVEARGGRGMSEMRIPLRRIAASAAFLTAGCTGEVALGLLAVGGAAFAVSRLWRTPVYRKPVGRMSPGDIRAVVEHVAYRENPHAGAVTALADLIKERPEFVSPPDVISPGERLLLAEALFTAWERERQTTGGISLVMGRAIVFVMGLMPVEEQATWAERVAGYVYERIAQKEASALFSQVPPEARNDLADTLLGRAEAGAGDGTRRWDDLRALSYLWPHLDEGVRVKWFPDVADLADAAPLMVAEIRSMTPGAAPA